MDLIKDLRAANYKRDHNTKYTSTETIRACYCAKCRFALGTATGFGDYVKGFFHLKCLPIFDTITQ